MLVGSTRLRRGTNTRLAPPINNVAGRTQLVLPPRYPRKVYSALKLLHVTVLVKFKMYPLTSCLSPDPAYRKFTEAVRHDQRHIPRGYEDIFQGRRAGTDLDLM